METMTHPLFIAAFFIFLGYYVVLAVYYFILGLVGFAVGHRRSAEDAEEDYRLLAASGFTLPVSVIMPAHNEEAWIADSVQSLLNLNYPEFELVIVDDGSTDRTLDILKEKLELLAIHNPYTDHFQSGKIRGLFKSAKYPHVTVLSKETGTKRAGAVNAGLNLARYKYVCDVDADTILEPDALMKVMAQVEKDPEKIIGVGSYFGLVNGFDIENGRVVGKNFLRSPLVAYQDLEYLRSFIGNRISWSQWNSMPDVAGGFGVWRRDVLLEMGGFDSAFSCEDIELTFRAHDYIAQHRDAGYKIVMLPYVAGWTEGPGTIRSLLVQRNRWHRATIETTLKFWRMLCNPRYGKFGFLTVPYFLFYEVFGIFFELGSIAVTILGFLAGVFDLKLVLGFLGFMTLFQAFTSLLPLVAFQREQQLFRPSEFIYFAFLSMVELFVYRWIIVVARITGTIDYFRGIRTYDLIPRSKKRSTGTSAAVNVNLQSAKA